MRKSPPRIPPLERFQTKYRVNPETGCWEWTGGRFPTGYGKFMWTPAPATVIPAHRAAYMLLVGEIPDTYEIDHLCNVRYCVNPAHLEAVTVQENRRRRNTPSGDAHFQRKKTHCVNGHEFSGDNLGWTQDGRRRCRACEREKVRRFRARKRANP